MNTIYRSWTTLMASITIITLNGCSSLGPQKIIQQPLRPQTNVQNLPQKPMPPKPRPKGRKVTPGTTVFLYSVNRTCETLIPKKVVLSKSKSMDQAVGLMLKQQDLSDLGLGYRVKLDPKNCVATIDLRTSPHAKRQITSLSICEQLAIFGSIRHTLINNSQWGIKKVNFTNLGQEIVF